MRVRVLIVDDEALARQRVRRLLQNEADVEVVGEAETGRDAVAMIRELQRISDARGAWVVFVQADPGDAPAVALYSGLGEREEVLHFDLRVR